MIMDIPLTEWEIEARFHPCWKAKDGDRWHVQLWHPTRHGFIFSHRGFKPKVTR